MGSWSDSILELKLLLQEQCQAQYDADTNQTNQYEFNDFGHMYLSSNCCINPV